MSLPKITTTQAASIRQVLRQGAIATSEWTNGSGRYVAKRAIPPFCALIHVHGVSPAADALFAARPRVRSALVVIDRDSALMAAAKF